MIGYTICFIRSQDQLLMLNRQKPPNMGLWNGVGGKIEPGESPYQAVLREVEEETGLRLSTVRFSGLITWGGRFDEIQGGMYVYLAEVDGPMDPPEQTPEGILAWKPLAWVLDPENKGVVSNIACFLPVMLQDATPYEHRCIYRHGVLKVCIRHDLAEEDSPAG